VKFLHPVAQSRRLGCLPTVRGYGKLADGSPYDEYDIRDHLAIDNKLNVMEI